MTLLMALLYTETNSQLGVELEGSLPDIIAEFDSYSIGDYEPPTGAAKGKMNGTQVLDKGVYVRYTTTEKTSFELDGVVDFKASYSNSVYKAKAGTNVVRSTSIGCSMWKRTV